MTTDDKMTIEERYQYLRRMQTRYRQANRSTKKTLLDKMECHTSLHRKSLIRLLNGDIQRRPRSRERERTYGPEVDAALALIWESLDYICPARLTPNLLDTAELLADHGELTLTPTLREQLGAISISTVRRHLPPQPLLHRRRQPTPPPNRHQRQIPAYRIPRDIDEPGHLELDLVHHCGETTQGEYVYTLHILDVATGWSGCQFSPENGPPVFGQDGPRATLAQQSAVDTRGKPAIIRNRARAFPTQGSALNAPAAGPGRFTRTPPAVFAGANDRLLTSRSSACEISSTYVRLYPGQYLFIILFCTMKIYQICTAFA